MLCEYVRNGFLNVAQAIKVVEDIFFNTSNKLYNLQLPLTKFQNKQSNLGNNPTELKILNNLLKDRPDIKFIRLQYVDYTATPRLRIIPVKRALKVLSGQAFGKGPGLEVGITKASLGHLQNHALVSGVDGTGEYALKAIFSSLRAGPTDQFASVQGEFRNGRDEEAVLCPRSILRRAVNRAKSSGLALLVGFEIEIIFLARLKNDTYIEARYAPNPSSSGHAWSSAKPIQSHSKMLVEISESLARAGIDLEQWHAEVSDP